MIIAGFPATTQFGGTDLVTTAPAPIVEFSPISIGPKTFAPQQTVTPFLNVGAPPHRQ